MTVLLYIARTQSYMETKRPKRYREYLRDSTKNVPLSTINDWKRKGVYDGELQSMHDK